jgi:hypothetical protein
VKDIKITSGNAASVTDNPVTVGNSIVNGRISVKVGGSSNKKDEGKKKKQMIAMVQVRYDFLL